jgi:orotate phosphoribosyltransferase
MDESILHLMAARRGHFLLESGHHGDLWLDVDRLFVNPAAIRQLVAQLAERLAPHCIDALCGPLTGGAFLAQMVAEQLGLPWVYANRQPPGWPVPSPRRAWSEQSGDSPTSSEDAERAPLNHAARLFRVAYPIPTELADVVRGRRVAVINDVTNAGSAVRGALDSLQAHNATPVVIATLLALGDAPAALAASAGIPLEALAHEPNTLWERAACPLCAAGEPLVSP